MKVRDLILISIIIAVLALATYNITIEQYTEGGILGAIAFYTLMYVIVSIVREKRLESELVMVNKHLTHYTKKSKMIWKMGDMVLRNNDETIYTIQGYDIEEEIYYTNQYSNNEVILIAFNEKLENAYIKQLETDLANQVKATDLAEKERDEYKRMYPSNLRDEQIISDLIDWQDQTGTFAEDTPYIGQMVKVKYGSTYKVAPITRILDEGAKGLRYRVRGCGSAKYKVSDFRDYDENEIPDYGVKLTKKE